MTKEEKNRLNMEREETIKRFAESIVLAVFLAETRLIEAHPEWKERLNSATDDTRKEVAEAYCRAIAEEIVNKSLGVIDESDDDSHGDESYDDGEVW